MSYVGRKSGRAALISADIPSNLNLLGDYVKIPSATTTERDALTPAVGMMLYNTTLGIMQQYASTGWASIDSPPTVSSLNYPGDDTALDTVGEYNDATCDYNNDPTIAHDANSNMKVGMSVSGTGIPVGATIASITSTTAFELSASTTGGAVTNGTLTFNTQTLIITGTNFSLNPTVAIDGTAPSTVTRNSSTQITVTGTPAKTAGTKLDGLVVTNTSGLASSINVDYSALPAWQTASGNVLNAFITGSAISTVDLDATSATSYAITSGALPGGLSMSTSTGDITGTMSGSAATFNFTVDAIDAQAQSSPRLFNIINLGAAPTGGIITTYTGFRVHTFVVGMSESFNFVVDGTTNVDYLIVAGGGGTVSYGGGAGAGGFRTSTSTVSISAGTYTVVVGAGGTAGSNNSSSPPAGAGEVSSFNSIESAGGGQSITSAIGGTGGSGAGGGSFTGVAGGAGNTPSTTPAQGNNGGSNSGAASGYAGGGGGGADADGTNATANNGGAGGVGKSLIMGLDATASLALSAAASTSSGSITGTGHLVSGARYYAGGGGGGSRSGGTSGAAGGSGGGGHGSYGSANITAGTPHTGGGAGANSETATSVIGGSGIVIIRYVL